MKHIYASLREVALLLFLIAPLCVLAEDKIKVTDTKIEPDAQKVLDSVEAAYGNLKTAEFSGKVTVDIQIPGQKQKSNQPFSSSFEAPNKFKHESQDGLLMGANGERAYIYNEKGNSYLWMDQPKEKVAIRNMPRLIPQILQTQNPSLLFALSKNPVQDVTESFDLVEKKDDVMLDGTTFTALQFTSKDNEGSVDLLIDTNTHLVRRFAFDFKPVLEQSGAIDVDNAKIVIDYTTNIVEPDFGTNQFAWSPPSSAFNLHEPAGAERPEGAERLTGRLAPDFTLKTLEGKPVSLSRLKGDVVVLEFWATWSPPCVDSLTRLSTTEEAVHNPNLKIFAVNFEEEKDRVATFMELKKLDVPVLLDERGETAKKYSVGTLPQIVVIGKDGRIAKTFTGTNENSAKDLRAAIDAALAMNARK